MKFGLFLVQQGVITADQLVAALEIQQQRSVPLGQLAIEECLMSARDVFRVLQSQREHPRDRFGEIAVDLGLITYDELQRLLMLQMNRKPALVDVLVRQGVLTPEKAELELAAFRQAMEERNVVKKHRIPTTPPHRATLPTLPDEARLEAAEAERCLVAI